MRRLAALAMLLVVTASPALAKHVTKGESGVASVYATKFIGRETASGQVLDGKRLTAAHRFLPFGTKLVVTNEKNGRKVVVTVTDRGPHRKGRILDLTPAAASKLGMLHAGLAKVEIKVASLRR